MLLCLASQVAPGHFPELQKTQHFLNLIVTMHVPSCVICVLLYIFNFMLHFMEPFSCSSSIFLNGFLNIYNGIMLPSLPVSILYGISVAVLPTCIFRCAVINDRFLLRYIGFILTVSTSSSWVLASPLLLLHELHDFSCSCIPSWSDPFSHNWCMISHMLDIAWVHDFPHSICMNVCEMPGMLFLSLTCSWVFGPT